MFYFTILILFIAQNVNAHTNIASKGLKLCQYGCLKRSTPIIENAIQQMAIKTVIAAPNMEKIGIEPEKQIGQKINSEQKQNAWRRMKNLLNRSHSKQSRKETTNKVKENEQPKIEAHQIHNTPNYCLPTGICSADGIEIMAVEGETAFPPAEDDKNEEELRIHEKKIIAENKAREFVNLLKQRSKKRLEYAKEEETNRRQESMIENFKRRFAGSRIQKFLNARKGGKIIQKIFEDNIKKQFAKKLIERKKTIQRLCHPNSIQNLGSSSNGSKGGSDEKDNPAGQQGTDEEKREAKKESGQIGAKNDGTDSEKVTAGISYKSAIRFALRAYFCNHINKKDNNDDNGWKSVGQFGLKEWMEMVEMEKNKLDNVTVKKVELQNVPVKRVERWFERSDPIYPHEYRADFKFTLFFPDEFTQLWTKFGLKAEDLLISLTAKNLDGFENPAKSKSWMVTSRDKQMFLKSVQMESKYLLDSILEKDFFFNMQKDGNLQFWNGKDYSSTKGYKGGFAYYFRYMMQEGNSEGKNGESSMTTLLPKFYGLFAFQEKDESTQLITIQNGIFPNVLPDINYKFDLKGSSNNRLLSIEEADEKIAKNEEPIWMDLNFIEHKQNNLHGFFRNGIQISEENWQKIKEVLEADSKFLASHNIVDYSLLLGVHFIDKRNAAANAENKEKLKYGIPAHCTNCSPNRETWKKDRRVKMQKQISEISQREVKNEESGYFSESDSDTESIHEDEDWENRREIRIYIGIIDIFQAYNGGKLAESIYKNAKVSVGKILRKTGSKIEEPPSVFPQNNDQNKEKKQLIEHSPITIIEPPKYQERFVDFLTTMVFRQENLEDEKF